MDQQMKDNILPKPKNFDANKLINPDIIIEEEDEEEEERFDETIDEMDDETLEIINRIRLKKMNLDDDRIFKEEPPKSIIKKTKKEPKENKKISYMEFAKIVEAESKPEVKKFSSKRAENKRNQLFGVSNSSIPKRHFNPRKPPYNFTRKNTNDTLPDYNIQEFPQLK